MFEKLFYSFPVFFWKPQLIPDMSSADFIPARVTLLVRSSSMGGMLAPLLISKAHRNFIKVLSFICFFLGTLAFYHLTHAPDFSKAAVYPFCDLYPNLDHTQPGFIAGTWSLLLTSSANSSLLHGDTWAELPDSKTLTVSWSTPSPLPRSLNTVDSNSDLTLTSAPATSFPFFRPHKHPSALHLHWGCLPSHQSTLLSLAQLTFPKRFQCLSLAQNSHWSWN